MTKVVAKVICFCFVYGPFKNNEMDTCQCTNDNDVKYVHANHVYVSV